MATEHPIPIPAGSQFNYWTVLEERPKRSSQRMVLARCRCGVETVCWLASLIKGTSKSCGCMKKHGRTKDPIYGVWASMVQRCTNPSNKSWKDYGARGISVCDRWLSFKSFAADMGPSHRPGLTIERLDNEKGYCPENCTWKTLAEQMRNKRSTVWIDTPRGPMLAQDIAKISGVSAGAIWRRVKYGVTGESLFLPSNPGKRCTVDHRPSPQYSKPQPETA